MIAVKNTGDYIAGFPKHIQKILKQLRSIIKKEVPNGQELISYNMPAYKINGILIWYAGCKNHIGFYPSSVPIRVFKVELAGFKTTKGAIRFPLDQPLPVELITKIIQFRVKEDIVKSTIKTKKK